MKCKREKRGVLNIDVHHHKQFLLIALLSSALSSVNRPTHWATSLFGLVFRSVFSLSPNLIIYYNTVFFSTVIMYRHSYFHVTTLCKCTFTVLHLLEFDLHPVN